MLKLWGYNLLTAAAPGKLGDVDDGHEEVVERPGDDDAVVDVEPEDDGHGGIANPLDSG